MSEHIKQYRQRRENYREGQRRIQAQRERFVLDQQIRSRHLDYERSRAGPKLRTQFQSPVVHQIVLRNSSPDIRNTPRPITTTYTVVSETIIPRTSALSWMERDRMRRLLNTMRMFGRAHPFIRAMEFALNVNDVLKMWEVFQRHNRDIQIPGGFDLERNFCGGGPGPLENKATWYATCSPQNYYSNAGQSAATASSIPYHNVDYNDRHGVFGWPRVYQNFRITRRTGTVGRPNFVPWYAPPQHLPIPVVTQIVPVPFRNLTNFTVPDPVAPPVPPRRPPLVPTTHRFAPPPPKTREMKTRLPAALAKAMNAAFEATEASDLIEALYDALPDHIKDATPRTGRTNRFARIGANVPYVSVMDKARAVYRNIRHINAPQAIYNVIYNHVEDYVVGRVNRQADGVRKIAGGTGWGWSF